MEREGNASDRRITFIEEEKRMADVNSNPFPEYPCRG